MAKKNDKFYLGKEGRVFGPFESAEVEKLYVSGEIRAYTFIWTPSATAWKAIEAFPPSPLEHEPGRTAEVKDSGPPWEVVCHDSHFFLVTGKLRNLTDHGCDLVSEDVTSSPKLQLRVPLILNVLDSLSKKAINMKIHLVNVRGQAGRWIYRVQWDAPPAF